MTPSDVLKLAKEKGVKILDLRIIDMTGLWTPFSIPVGQLNEESIFYLRSRGLGAETARRMLIHAFAGEIIERIRCQPIREELDQLIWERLEANPLVAAGA